MGNNSTINNLTAKYDGSHLQCVNTSSKDLASNLIYTGEFYPIKSICDYDYGITLNEDAIKEIVEKLTKQKEIAKITPDDGPEIPKWTGFLDI